jgi:hypothetical protein
MEKEFYKGSLDYNRATKKFIPDEGMIKIESMLKTMEFCLGGNHNEGTFFYRPSDDTWWHLHEYETSESLLERTTREHIEKTYTYIECDNRIRVHWFD